MVRQITSSLYPLTPQSQNPSKLLQVTSSPLAFARAAPLSCLASSLPFCESAQMPPLPSSLPSRVSCPYWQSLASLSRHHTWLWLSSPSCVLQTVCSGGQRPPPATCLSCALCHHISYLIARLQLRPDVRTWVVSLPAVLPGPPRSPIT